MMTKDTKQTLLKTLSYGLMHVVIAFAIAYWLSGSWKIAVAIGLIEPCAQTIAFFFHEKAWHRWGRQENGMDAHNSVIDSVSPATRPIENLLRDKHHDES